MKRSIRLSSQMEKRCSEGDNGGLCSQANMEMRSKGERANIDLKSRLLDVPLFSSLFLSNVSCFTISH
jgi:hypothetical protein